MLRRLLAISLLGFGVGCQTVSPTPDLCTDWTPERIVAYDELVRSGASPVVAQMVVEWNESCAANAEIAGKPWGEVIDSRVCVGNRFTCWWEGIGW